MRDVRVSGAVSARRRDTIFPTLGRHAAARRALRDAHRSAVRPGDRHWSRSGDPGCDLVATSQIQRLIGAGVTTSASPICRPAWPCAHTSPTSGD